SLRRACRRPAGRTTGARRPGRGREREAGGGMGARPSLQDVVDDDVERGESYASAAAARPQRCASIVEFGLESRAPTGGQRSHSGSPPRPRSTDMQPRLALLLLAASTLAAMPAGGAQFFTQTVDNEGAVGTFASIRIDPGGAPH